MSVPPRLLLLLPVFVVALAARALTAAQQDDARIYGRVVTESGAPIRGVAVTLTVPGTRTWTMSTDENGTFEANGLPPGSYQLRLAKTGFLASDLYRNLPALKTGEAKDVGTIVMRRAGAIAGRVVDESGEPVVHATVSVSRIVYSPPGSRRLASIKVDTTNDLGEYRLFGLEPGTYYVAASTRGLAVSVDMARVEQNVTFRPAEQPQSFAPTFFPSASHESEAQPIRLAIGETAVGIDIGLVRQQLSSVSGRVLMADGTAAVDAVVTLDAVKRSDADMPIRQTARVSTNGTFSIANVLPGQYTVIAYSRDYAPPIEIGAVIHDPQTGARVVKKPEPRPIVRGLESARSSLNVIGDMSGLDIQLARSFEIRGRVLVDGVPRSAGTTQMMAVVFDERVRGPRPNPPTATVQQNGDFLIAGAPPGRARLTVVGMSPTAMVSRISVNGVDVTDEGFDVVGPINSVEIAVTMKPAVVTGVVRTPAGNGALSHVLFFSENSRLWMIPGTRYVQIASSSPASGEFSASRLPPGRYFAVALQAVDQFTWADPENLAELRKVATPFTMPESGAVTVNLILR